MEFNPFKKRENRSRLAAVIATGAIALSGISEKKQSEEKVTNVKNKTEVKKNAIDNSVAAIDSSSVTKIQEFIKKEGDGYRYSFEDRFGHNHSLRSSNGRISDYVFIESTVHKNNLFIYDISEKGKIYSRLNNHSDTALKGLQEFIQKVTSENLKNK